MKTLTELQSVCINCLKKNKTQIPGTKNPNTGTKNPNTGYQKPKYQKLKQPK